MQAAPGTTRHHGRRLRSGVRALTASATIIVLAACSHPDAPASINATSPPSADAAGNAPTAPGGQTASRFASKRWGFTIDYPEDWKVHHDFGHSYLQSGTWKAYAGPDSNGTSVVALTEPGSNQITDAEIRIGVSEVPEEVQQCANPPQAVRAGSVGEATIHGIRFTRFEAGDAAMSHYLDVQAWRAVHDGTCYAIDLLVYGTNPQVYDPPATPPFTHQQAFARMRAVLRSFRFTR